MLSRQQSDFQFDFLESTVCIDTFYMTWFCIAEPQTTQDKVKLYLVCLQIAYKSADKTPGKFVRFVPLVKHSLKIVLGFNLAR